MTIEQLVAMLAENQQAWIIFLLSVPLIAVLLTSFLRPAQLYSPASNYVISVLIFAAAVPGVFSLVLCLYTMTFLQQNLLQVNIWIYYLPIITMAFTLVYLSKKIDLRLIPGFDRIQGLLGVLGLTTFVFFLLTKLRLWVIVGGGWLVPLLVVVGIYLLFRWSLKRLSGKGAN